MIREQFVRIGFTPAVDLAKHMDLDLIALISFDIDGAPIGLKDELATGCDLKSFFDILLKILCQRRCS